MRTRTLLLLLLVTLGVLGYIKFFATKQPGTVEREHAQRQVMVLPLADINHIEIVSPKGSLVLDRSAKNDWQILSPVKYPANNNAIEQLLSQLATAERRTTLKIDKPGDADETQKAIEQLGLKTVETALKLSTSKGENFELSLGKDTAVVGTLYAKITQKDRSDYIVIDQTLAALFQKSLDEWRSDRVFDFTSDQIRDILLHQESKEVEVKTDTQDVWHIIKPLTATADEQEMRSFLANLQAIHAAKFVTDNPADYTTYGLNSPYVVLDITLANKEVVSLRIGRADSGDGAKFYAQQTARPAVFEIPKATVDYLADMLNKVRDSRLIHLDNDEEVNSIRYQSGNFSIKLNSLPDNAGWQIEGDDSFLADPAVVQILLNKLRDARATNYQLATDDNRVAFGLKNPVTTVVLGLRGQTGVASAATFLTLKFSAEKQGELAVESSVRDDIVNVPAAVLVGVPNQLLGWLAKTVKLSTDNEISAISWQHGREVEALDKNEQGAWEMTLQGSTLNSELLDRQIRLLQALPVLAWRAVTDREFASPLLTLTVNKGTGQKNVQFIADAATGQYVGRFAGTKYGFIISAEHFLILNDSPLQNAQ